MECGWPGISGPIQPHEFNAALRTGFAGKVLSDTSYVGLCSDIENNSPLLVYPINS